MKARLGRWMPTTVIAGLLLLLCALGMHGFSVTHWHKVIDATPEDEILAGESRPIRSDDWFVVFPFAFAQRAHEPAFPVVNEAIGYGQNMLVVFNAPVAHPLIVFRPFTWGYFVGNDFGLAWYWWARIFALALLGYHLCVVLSDGQRLFSAFASGTLVMSPFLQFWSFVYAETVVGMLGTVLAFRGVLVAESRIQVWIAGLLLGWSAGIFAFTLYPPFLITLAYVAVALVVGLYLREKARIHARFEQFRLERVFALVLGGAISVGGLSWFFAVIGDALPAMMNTEYPGRRYLTGGGWGWIQIFANLLFVFRIHELVHVFSNISEAGAFLLVFPAVAVVVLWQRLGRRIPVSPAVWPLMVVVAFLIAYISAGFPPWLAEVTQLRRVQEPRMVLALGVANLALVAALAGSRITFGPKTRVALALVWMLIMARPFRLLYKHGMLPIDGRLAATVVFLAAVGYLMTWRLTAAAALLLAASTFASVRFNPIVRGGARYLLENPVSKKMLDVAKRGEGRWAVFGGDLPNLPRMLGLRTINGTHFYPQFDFWKVLDPKLEHTKLYNRFAHVAIEAKVAGDTLIEVPVADTIWLKIDPAADAFRKWGVRYYLVSGDTAAFDSRPEHFVAHGTVGRHAVYEWRDSGSKP